ncbi:MAG TPA: RES domain-containing protein [Edaphobacter sp.]|nr:RES domain-containing protein [Edaphobacter sp.]
MKAWRITKQKHARTAFSGEGARLYGGRWNSPGVPVVYVAESQSLAVLEVLVHLDAPAFLEKYVFLEVNFDASLVITLDRSSLPKNWQSDPVPEAIQAVGDRWILSRGSAVLHVPSVLVPEESNFLLNPRHPDFGKIGISRPQAFRFDPRLARRQ